MTNKTIIISHGEKGGCGKSHIAMIAAAALSKTEAPIRLIDADASASNRDKGDVASRFETDLHSNIVPMAMQIAGEDGDAEERVGNLLDYIAHCREQIVLVNLPANASQTLESEGYLVAEAVEELGYDLFVLYSFEPTSGSISGLIKNTQSAIMRSAQRVVLIRNEHFGAQAAYDAALNDEPGIADLPRATVPVLPGRGVNALKNNPDMDLAALANDPNRESRWTLRKTMSSHQRLASESIFNALGFTLDKAQAEKA